MKTQASQPAESGAAAKPGADSATVTVVVRKPTTGEAEDEEADDEEGEADAEELAFTAVAPERFVEGRDADVQGSGHQTREFDVDGDGKLELIVPSWRGEIAIISAGGEHVRKLRLRGLSIGMSIVTVKPVRVKGDLQWLVCYGRHGGVTGLAGVSVGLFNADGVRLWRYRLPGWKRMSATVTMAVADLTGDGEPEYVLGVTAMKMRKTSEHSAMSQNQRGYLIVLDAQGAPLACRRFDQRVEYLAVSEPDAAGGRVILLFDGSAMRRLYYDRVASSRPAEERNEDRKVDDEEEEEEEEDAD